MVEIEEAAGRISRLEVQGATNVAFTAVEALVRHLKALGTANRDEIYREIVAAKEILFASRETEPFMRNAIRFIEWSVNKSEWETLEEFQGLIEGLSKELLEEFRVARDRITNVGSRRIIEGTKVLTHCHSSAVTGILKEAKRKGVNFEVYLTETRPVYQGRITAKEMIETGIPATMMVDSAVRTFINGVDLVLVGSDAITSEGNVINKIGTSLIALAAQEARVPFYVASELLKFDPQTIHGDFEAIEQRSPDEIWSDAPDDLRIMNPAFDVTRREYIHGVICEGGVISPHSIMEAVRRHYPWILEASLA
ncbi:MAG: S-methyl-5-thioribose-1-phosphate isomerase [Candidatus Bathyarchaeota archaeon]|jgi:ribose 1,5-bisphosphate isomerase